MSARSNHHSKRRRFVSFVAALVAVAPAARACQYCRQAADPEAYRFLTEGRKNGGFPADSGLGGYAVDPGAPAALAPAPVATATTRPVPPAGALPSPPRIAATPVEAVVTAPVSRAGFATTWADVGLLGLGVVGGVFAWRTRRTAAG